jgi:hypothetical protein
LRLRSLVVLSLPALLFIASCAHRHRIPAAPDIESEIVIFLEVVQPVAPDTRVTQNPGSTRYSGPQVIKVTPRRARVRWPHQKVVWVSDRPEDQIVSIEFLEGKHPNPRCGEGRRCEAAFERGRPGRHPYRVTIRRGDAVFERNPPELIIDF